MPDKVEIIPAKCANNTKILFRIQILLMSLIEPMLIIRVLIITVMLVFYFYQDLRVMPK